MKAIYRNLSTKQLVVIGLVVPLLCAMLIGYLQWQSVNDMLKTRELVRQIRSIQLGLGVLRYSVSDAESFQFRYILTKNPVNLELYRKLIGQTHDQLDSLLTLTQNDAGQRAHLAEVSSLLADKEKATEESLATLQSGNGARALQLISSDVGRQNMLAIEQTIEKMQALELQTLLVGQNQYSHHITVASVLSVASMTVSLACVFSVVLLFRRLAHLQTEVTLEALREMMKFEDGTMSIEEYLRRRHQALALHGKAQIEAERLLGQLERRKSRASV